MERGEAMADRAIERIRSRFTVTLTSNSARTIQGFARACDDDASPVQLAAGIGCVA